LLILRSKIENTHKLKVTYKQTQIKRTRAANAINLKINHILGLYSMLLTLTFKET